MASSLASIPNAKRVDDCCPQGRQSANGEKNWSSYEGHTEDALALRGDEGRGKLR